MNYTCSCLQAMQASIIIICLLFVRSGTATQNTTTMKMHTLLPSAFADAIHQLMTVDFMVVYD